MGGEQRARPGRRGVEQRRQPGQRHDQDADARGRRGDPATSARPSTASPRSSTPAARSSTATRTGCRSTFYGTTPGYLRRPRLGRDWPRASRSPTQDVRDVALVCLLGQTLVARAVRRRVAGRQGGARQRRAAPGHRRPEPQGDQHHRRGPGRHPARPLDDDQVPDQRRRRRRRRAAAAARPRDLPSQFNLLPPPLSRGSRRSLYPRASATQVADTPRLERFSNVDSILVRADVDRRDPRRDGPDHRAAPRAAPDRRRAGGRLRRPRLHRGHQGRRGDGRPGGRACWCAWR